MAKLKLPLRYRRRTPGFWLAFTAAWAGGALSIGLLLALMLGGESHEQAMQARQRAIVMIESGELVMADTAAQSPPAPQTPATPMNGALTSTPMPGSFGTAGGGMEMPANHPEPIPPAEQAGEPPVADVADAPAPPAGTPPTDPDAITILPEEPVAAEPVDTVRSGLAIAPQPGLLEQTAMGDLPVAGDDGRAAWQVYARPSDAARPMVAIVVTNLGLGNFTSEQALTLPLDVTLAFSPYGRQSPAWAAKAREMGFEILVELPAEPADYPRTDPGPYALLGSLTPEENLRRLHWVLSRFPGYVGLVTPPEASLHRYREQADYFAGEVARRGLLWLQGAPRADAPQVTGEASGMVVQADLVLDEALTGEAIMSRLGDLGTLARRQGTAIAIARPYPLTLETIGKWLAAEKAVRLAPLSAVAQSRLDAPANASAK